MVNNLLGLTGYLTSPVRCIFHKIYSNVTHFALKHTPYELVFGQPPYSLLIPDIKLAGRLDEDDLGEVQVWKYGTCVCDLSEQMHT